VRNLVQPPPSAHCSRCGGDLRLKLSRPPHVWMPPPASVIFREEHWSLAVVCPILRYALVAARITCYKTRSPSHHLGPW
jgi:hypothetical protein